MALKKKKAYDAQIDKINGTRMTIETQVMAIENANVNLETMNALRGGAEAMKNIHGSMYVYRSLFLFPLLRIQLFRAKPSHTLCHYSQ